METTSPLAPSLTAADAEDAPTTGRKSTRSPRVELITRGEHRRVWTPEQKREIVMESLGPELTPTEVARKYAIPGGAGPRRGGCGVTRSMTGRGAVPLIPLLPMSTPRTVRGASGPAPGRVPRRASGRRLCRVQAAGRNPRRRFGH